MSYILTIVYEHRAYFPNLTDKVVYFDSQRKYHRQWSQQSPQYDEQVQKISLEGGSSSPYKPVYFRLPQSQERKTQAWTLINAIK